MAITTMNLPIALQIGQRCLQIGYFIGKTSDWAAGATCLLIAHSLNDDNALATGVVRTGNVPQAVFECLPGSLTRLEWMQRCDELCGYAATEEGWSTMQQCWFDDDLSVEDRVSLMPGTMETDNQAHAGKRAGNSR
jgi:hypothetical protein